MTLRELIKTYPSKFYPQTWYAEEKFMDTPAPLNLPAIPVILSNRGMPPALIMWHMEDLVPAVTLAALYVKEPEHPIWLSYLWTSDYDYLGQQVYLGDNGTGLEIHRHLAITDRWGVPRWG